MKTALFLASAALMLSAIACAAAGQYDRAAYLVLGAIWARMPVQR